MDYPFSHQSCVTAALVQNTDSGTTFAPTFPGGGGALETMTIQITTIGGVLPIWFAKGVAAAVNGTPSLALLPNTKTNHTIGRDEVPHFLSADAVPGSVQVAWGRGGV